MNSKKKPSFCNSIGNIITFIMLKLMLKIIKKETKEKKQRHLPKVIMFPKILPLKLSPYMAKSDILLENKKIVYRCGICSHKFVLKSDMPLKQNMVMQWMQEVKGHKCHDS